MWVLPSAPPLSHTFMNVFLMRPATWLVFQSFSKGRGSRTVKWVLQNLRSRQAEMLRSMLTLGNIIPKHIHNKNVETYRNIAQLSELRWFSDKALPDGFLSVDAAKCLSLAALPLRGADSTETWLQRLTPMTSHHPAVTRRHGKSLGYFFLLCFLISVLTF